jgi:hypothetical protein
MPKAAILETGAETKWPGRCHRGEVVFEKPIVQRNLKPLLWIRKMMQQGMNLMDVVRGWR